MADVQNVWWKQQVDALSDVFQELLCDDDPANAVRAIDEAIKSWEDYHEKELTKWQQLRRLLHVERISDTQFST